MKRVLKEIAQFTLIAIFIVLPFRLFVAQPFVVNGESMFPTFHSGDYLIVDQISYRFDEPKRNSVVVFRYPYDPSKFFIKRIIGLPGETVILRDGIVTIQNNDGTEEFVLDESHITETNRENLEVTLKEDEYFVMGDNRTGSSDSRTWGPLEEQYIIGRPFVQLFPVNHVALFPGHLTE